MIEKLKTINLDVKWDEMCTLQERDITVRRWSLILVMSSPEAASTSLGSGESRMDRNGVETF